MRVKIFVKVAGKASLHGYHSCSRFVEVYIFESRNNTDTFSKFCSDIYIKTLHNIVN